MKRIVKIFTVLLAGLIAYACTPDEYGLGSLNVKSGELVEGIAFKIEHDAGNPNIIYLTSLMDNSFTPLWDHPQGRSQKTKVTLKIPFPGTYTVKFGVQTRGGIVYGEPVTFTVDEFYSGFVDHEMWTLLTGGVGESKTWIHDNGAYGLASGEVDYADPTTTVEWNNFSTNWAPGKGHTGDDNIWGSTMTFSLDGGANVAVKNVSTTGTTNEAGTFMLDVDNHTITLTDANVMHTQGWNFKTTNWARGLKVLKLTENQLQIAVLRELVSGESEWWLIWNYVSKEYADNYVPADEEDPIPDIGGDPNDILTTTRTKVWALSADSPYDWADLNGNLLNNFTGGEATYIATGWAAYDANMIAATKLTFTSLTATGGTYIFKGHDQDDIAGSYTIDQNNDITFDQPLSALISQYDFPWTSSMYLNTTTERKLRVLKTKSDVFGNVTDMWLGQRAADKDEYMVFHFNPQTGGGGSVDNGITIAFDNSKMLFGDLEGKGHVRLELYNEFGGTVGNPGFTLSELTFSNELSITFTLGGITLKSGAVGTYTAALSLADADWNPQYWGDVPGNGTVSVTGNGTYTLKYVPASTSSGAVVFVIDIKSLVPDIEDLSTLTATISSIKIK